MLGIKAFSGRPCHWVWTTGSILAIEREGKSRWAFREPSPGALPRAPAPSFPAPPAFPLAGGGVPGGHRADAVRLQFSRLELLLWARWKHIGTALRFGGLAWLPPAGDPDRGGGEGEEGGGPAGPGVAVACC